MGIPDDFLRAHAAIIRSTNALAASSIGSAPTTNIGAASAESVQITGTTTITSFGTAPAGIRRECRFSGSLTITHSSNIQLPNAEDITTQAGDVITFRSLGSGQWIMTGMSRPDAVLSSNVPRLDANNVFTGSIQRISHNNGGTLLLTDANATANGGNVWMFPGSNSFFMQAVNDDLDSATTFLHLSRNGTTLSQLTLSGGGEVELNGATIDINGACEVSGTLDVQGLTSLSGLELSNSTIRGVANSAALLANGAAIRGRNSLGATRHLISLFSDNVIYVGDANQDTSIDGSSVNVSANTLTHGGVDIYAVASRITGSTFSAGRVLATTSNVTLTTGIPAGRIGCIYNSSGSSITIGQGSGLTLRLAGTSSTGSRTLAPRGFATVWTNSTSEYIISGAGLS